MSYVIIFTNPSNGKVGYVSDDAGEMATYRTWDDADRAADNTTVCRVFPYAIIEAP